MFRMQDVLSRPRLMLRRESTTCVTTSPFRSATICGRVAAAAGAKKPIHLPGFLGKVMFGQVWNYFSRSQRVSNAKLKHLTGWEPRIKSAVEGWPMVAAELAGKSGSDSVRGKAA